MQERIRGQELETASPENSFWVNFAEKGVEGKSHLVVAGRRCEFKRECFKTDFIAEQCDGTCVKVRGFESQRGTGSSKRSKY